MVERCRKPAAATPSAVAGRRSTVARCLLPVSLLIVAAPSLAHAQQVEVPIFVTDTAEAEVREGDTELNLANLVQTAAKGVTTVQEAPAIITVIPGDEIADRSSRNLEDVIDRVPGWLRYGAEYGQFPGLAPRGTFQATLLLRDGVSMFDTMFNIATVSRVQPLETVKRLEVVTGPGGVLWGANSFLGVINVISKDADDVDGVEVSVGGGTGDGDRDVLRGYLMAGAPRLLGGKVKLFAHASFETYKGPIRRQPNHLFGSPTPQPNGLELYGPITDSDPAQSMIFNFDGKLSVGSFNFYWSAPFAEENYSVGFPGGVVREHLAEDNLPECTPVDRNSPDAGSGADRCVDRGRVYRRDQLDFYERYGIAEYKARLRENRAGLTTKAYLIQFVRKFDPITILNPVPQLLEGGLAFTDDQTSYRAGATIDGDLELARNLRLLYGAEGFRVWVPSTVTESRQGAGGEARFIGPYNVGVLPLPCPRRATWDAAAGDVTNVALIEDCPVTFAFAADRTEFGAFASLQWRVTPRLILDGGVRGQVAPRALSSRGYDPTPIGSGAVVYEFLRDWHAKLNVTQGFRPPVFNNTDSNSQAVSLLGSPDLKVETSTAFQGEVNARLLKGRRRIRELDLRADYSYTRLSNVIIVNNGRYTNGAPRGVSSAEVLAKMYVKGDHRIELGYTWLRTTTEDKGAYRSTPEHWFNIGGVLTLVPRTLELNATLRIFGAFEDPNLRVEARDLQYDPETGSASFAVPGQIVAVNPTEKVLDRIPPGGELQLGLRYHGWKDRLTIAATAYNMLNAQRYQFDAFMDYEPRNEFVPNPYERFRFFASATVAY